MDVEPLDNLRNNTPVQDKDPEAKQPRRKRARVKSNPAEVPAPSQNERLHVEPRISLPDVNRTDVESVGFQTHGDQQENGIIAALRPLEKDIDVQHHLGASEFNNFSALPSDNVISTQSMYVDGRPLLFPLLQNTGMHHGDASNLYNRPGEYGHTHDWQRSQNVMNEPHIRPEDVGVHVRALDRSANEIPGGDLCFAMFNPEQIPPIDSQFDPAMENLSLDCGGLNSPPFDLGIDGSSPLEDFWWNDDLIQCFGA
jgi:ethylene-insensitive protein 3